MNGSIATVMLFVQSSSSGCVGRVGNEARPCAVSVSLVVSMGTMNDERCFALAVSVVSAEEFDGELMQG